MTKPLPQRDVVAKPNRQGPPRLTGAQRQALSSIKDENLRRVLGELLIANAATQENFQELEQWFPVQPADVANALKEGGSGEGGLSAVGVIEHGEEGAAERPETFGHYIWIGTATPVNAKEHDFWVKSVAATSEDLLKDLNAMPVLDRLGNRAENPLGAPWEKPTWGENVGKTLNEANGHGWVSQEGGKIGAALYPTRLSVPVRGSIATQVYMTMGNFAAGFVVHGLWLLNNKVQKTGYRMTHISGGTGKAKVKLERWDNGVGTVLGETANEEALFSQIFTLLVDPNGVSVWRENYARTALVQILSSPDNTYTAGYTAIESNQATKEPGVIGDSVDTGGFRAAEIPVVAGTYATLYFKIGASWYSL